METEFGNSGPGSERSEAGEAFGVRTDARPAFSSCLAHCCCRSVSDRVEFSSQKFSLQVFNVSPRRNKSP